RRSTLSTLGAALYLFNPLGYALAFTFMSDAAFTAVMVIAVYCYVRGLQGEGDARWIVAGSVAAAAAALVRQPGMLLPLAAATVLLLDRRARWRQPRPLLVFKAVAIPLFAY